MTPSSRTVVIDAALPPAQRAKLAALSPELRIVDGFTPENLREAEVIFLNNGKFAMADTPKLKWVQFNSAGIGRVQNTPVAASGIPVANASGAYSTTVGTMAITLMLALFRRLPLCFDLQGRRSWVNPAEICGLSTRGRTLGILGYGSIGREVARLGQALGMRVLACKRRPAEHAEDRFRLPETGDPEGVIPEAWFGFEEMETMFRGCDVIVVTLPGTPATQGLLNRMRLETLPPHAVLINVGRGSVIDEPALVEVMRSGRLAGAALDVTNEEPLPAASPLWTLPNMIITPHVASYTDDATALAAEVLIENMRRHLAGKSILNRIDFKAGY